jgi:aryl-alcohol dehydrogenase-like predicted oxidoreductase
MAQRPEPYEHLRNETVFAALDAFHELADRRGVPMATIAFAWLLAQPGVTAIVTGPRRPEHLASAVEALSVPLSPDELDEIGALFRR